MPAAHDSKDSKDTHAYEAVPVYDEHLDHQEHTDNHDQELPVYTPSDSVSAAPEKRQPQAAAEPLLPAPATHPKDEQDDFETGLFDCFGDARACLPATFCTSCLFANTATHLNQPVSETYDPQTVNRQWSSYLNFETLAYVFLEAASNGVGNVFYRTLKRRELRRKYDLQGSESTKSLAKDFAVSCACVPCALAQENMEVNKREGAKFQQQQAALEAQFL